MFVTLANIMKKMNGPITGTTLTSYVKTLVNFPGYITPPITCTALVPRRGRLFQPADMYKVARRSLQTDPSRLLPRDAPGIAPGAGHTRPVA